MTKKVIFTIEKDSHGVISNGLNLIGVKQTQIEWTMKYSHDDIVLQNDKLITFKYDDERVITFEKSDVTSEIF